MTKIRLLALIMRVNCISVAVISSSCSSAVNVCQSPSTQRWIRSHDSDTADHRLILRTIISATGQFLWNGTEVSEKQLITYLLQTQRMDPAPYFIVTYDTGVRCSDVIRVRKVFEKYARCGREAPCSEQGNP